MKGDRKTGKVEPLVSVWFPVCVRLCYSRFTPNLRPVLAVCVPGLVSEPGPPFSEPHGLKAGQTLLDFGMTGKTPVTKVTMR